MLGYVRSLEVTVNDQDLENITYHAHFHVLLFMKREYFSDLQNYLEQSEWTNLWRRAFVDRSSQFGSLTHYHLIP